MPPHVALLQTEGRVTGSPRCGQEEERGETSKELRSPPSQTRKQERWDRLGMSNPIHFLPPSLPYPCSRHLPPFSAMTLLQQQQRQRQRGTKGKKGKVAMAKSGRGARRRRKRHQSDGEKEANHPQVGLGWTGGRELASNRQRRSHLLHFHPLPPHLLSSFHYRCPSLLLFPCLYQPTRSQHRPRPLVRLHTDSTGKPPTKLAVVQPPHFARSTAALPERGRGGVERGKGGQTTLRLSQP
mmetsp:Transcript_6446/g.15957  ORF Transcript_6446/g.15957 Transcript_6446/m.15957 type:complete len:240 (+) Transcript_6446:1171-1890(+)